MKRKFSLMFAISWATGFSGNLIRLIKAGVSLNILGICFSRIFIVKFFSPLLDVNEPL